MKKLLENRDLLREQLLSVSLESNAILPDNMGHDHRRKVATTRQEILDAIKHNAPNSYLLTYQDEIKEILTILDYQEAFIANTNKIHENDNNKSDESDDNTESHEDIKTIDINTFTTIRDKLLNGLRCDPEECLHLLYFIDLQSGKTNPLEETTKERMSASMQCVEYINSLHSYDNEIALWSASVALHTCHDTEYANHLLQHAMHLGCDPDNPLFLDINLEILIASEADNAIIQEAFFKIIQVNYTALNDNNFFEFIVEFMQLFLYCDSPLDEKRTHKYRNYFFTTIEHYPLNAKHIQSIKYYIEDIYEEHSDKGQDSTLMQIQSLIETRILKNHAQRVSHLYTHLLGQLSFLLGEYHASIRYNKQANSFMALGKCYEAIGESEYAYHNYKIGITNNDYHYDEEIFALERMQNILKTKPKQEKYEQLLREEELYLVAVSCLSQYEQHNEELHKRVKLLLRTYKKLTFIQNKRHDRASALDYAQKYNRIDMTYCGINHSQNKRSN